MEDAKEIPAVWNGNAFIPDSNAAKAFCARAYRMGQPLTVFIMQERTERTHNHQFAWLDDALENLPERYSEAPWAASPEHLRKYALISTGFFNVKSIATESDAEALRWSEVLRTIDPFSVVAIRGDVVHLFTAQSQSMKAMGKERFQRSKTAILNFVANIIGATPEELAQMGRKRRKKNA